MTDALSTDLTNKPCRHCESFRKGKEDWGECHFDQPVIVQSLPAKAGRHIGHWPAVKDHNSCGKWMGTITLKQLDKD